MRFKLILIAAAAVALVAPSAAFATGEHVHGFGCGHCDPDTVGSGSSTIDGPFGTYTVLKEFEVFADNNCGNPHPVAGSFTYVYKLSNDPLSTIGIIGFKVPIVSAESVLAAGFVDAEGIEPDTTTVTAAEVQWDFFTTPIPPGEMSEYLYIVSPYKPGDAEVTINGEFALDASGQCIAPVELPEPVPCSAFFWKLRSKHWSWVSDRYFPGSQFDDVMDRAVELSGGHFADRDSLKNAVEKEGFMTSRHHADNELASSLFNLAAGELYPGNTKCRLFHGSKIDRDGDGNDDTTVGEEVGDMITEIDSDNEDMCRDAFRRGLDSNMGRTVRGAVRFH